MTGSSHEPVLVNEVIDALDINATGYYLDGTFGRGGHAQAILNLLGAEGRLFAIDKDQQAIDYAYQHFEHENRLHAVKSSFANLDTVLSSLLIGKKLDGALFDFGVSSPQLDQADRGFSFRHNGPLDMRMDQHGKLTAASWINAAEESELRDVFRRFGEERYAARIARKIVCQRLESPIVNTHQLAELVAEAVPTREKGKHPATRVFQAIRIRINAELEEIQLLLPQILTWLKPGARLAIISFHSLEDRIVKRFLRDAAIGDDFPKDLAVTKDMLNPSVKLIGKPIKPGKSEINRNPRARSAVLRVAEKLEQKA